MADSMTIFLKREFIVAVEASIEHESFASMKEFIKRILFREMG